MKPIGNSPTKQRQTPDFATRPAEGPFAAIREESRPSVPLDQLTDLVKGGRVLPAWETHLGFAGEIVVPVPHSYLDTPEQTVSDEFRSISKPSLLRTLADFRPDQAGIAEFVRERGEKPRAAKIAACGSYLEIAWAGEDPSRDEDGRRMDDLPPARVVDGNLCDQNKLCPTCAHIYAMRRFAKLLPQVQCVLHQPEPAYLPVLVTLTVKNGPDLRERFKHLVESLDRVRQAVRNAQRRGTRCEFARFAGVVWSFEFTHRETGWHPHVHGIALVRTDQVHAWTDDLLRPGWRYPLPSDVHALRDEWRAATRGDSWVLNVRPFDCCRELVNEPDTRRAICSNPDSLAGGLLEGLKYVTKFEPGNYPDRWDIFTQTRCKMLVKRWGVLRQVKPCSIQSARREPPIVGTFQYDQAARLYRNIEVARWKGRSPTAD